MIHWLEKIRGRKKTGIKEKIGILYICTGKYNIFWNKFYKTSRKRFCKQSEVHYFVFTEHAINQFNDPLVHHIFQPRLGWPYDTLKRFHIFLDHKEKLMEMDYLFFFNANMVFVSRVKEADILPQGINSLVSVIHPCFFNHQQVPPFEDNKESVAYVKATADTDYFQGCLSGGRTSGYLDMAAQIRAMVDKDLERSIIAKWWDESYMNKYFLDNRPQPVDPGFAYPESMTIPFKKRIVQLDKAKSGGHEFLRAE